MPRPGERGSVAVEFVLVFTLLATMLFIMFDAGRLLNTNLVVTMAAREGARRAAIAGGDFPEVRERVEQLIEAGNLDPGKMSLTIQPTRARYGTTVTLRIDYRFVPQTTLLRAAAGGEVPLVAQVVTRSERLAER